MTYRWQYKGAGAEGGRDFETQDFMSQGDAETWLSDNWPELADDGVAEVTLVSGASEIYRMKLEPAD